MFRDLLENSEQIRKQQEKEIESLRSELKDVVQALNDEERRGDEWKRRYTLAWEWMGTRYGYPEAKKYSEEFIYRILEAANWLEEEDDADQKGLWGLEEQ